MTLTRFLAATCSILALAGCGRSQSPPAETKPAAEETAASVPTPATEPAPPVTDEASKPAASADAAPAEDAPIDVVAGPETLSITSVSSPTRPLATATDRLTDQDVKALLERIENKRAAFEAALDQTLKNSTIRGPRGEVNTNEFFDDLQDQVRRTADRFASNYSASSEVLSLLQFAARLDAWASAQPAGFRGSKEWGALASDFRRLSAAYNSALLRPGQRALGAQARRVNDAELMAAVANVGKHMEAFRSAYDSALTGNTTLTSTNRQSAIHTVDGMRSGAEALHAALEKKQKGVGEANALLRGTGTMIDATLKLPADSATAAAWTPVREDLAKVALAYEVLVASPGVVTAGSATGSALPLATATDRLTDQEIQALLARIESERSAFEAALDDTLKNAIIRAPRGEVKTNEFFDDVQDQVQRSRERFSSTYSASSEVLALLQLAARLDTWASAQPAGFRGSKEWGVLAADFRRLAAAYNTTLLNPGQPARGEQARRLNDAELVTAVANVEKHIDGFRTAYDGALTGNPSLTPASRETAIQNVDAMKSSARALKTALDKKQKGVAEANALLKGSGAMIDATLRLPPNSSAAAAWTPVREELSKVALGYEVAVSR
jgi:hypothetical protein